MVEYFCDQEKTYLQIADTKQLNVSLKNFLKGRIWLIHLISFGTYNLTFNDFLIFFLK